MGKKKKVKDYANPTKDGNKKGQFVGNPAQIHIHLVKDKTHIKYSGKRHNFKEDDADRIKELYNDLLKIDKLKNVSGYTNCLHWLYEKYKALRPG